MKNTPLSRKGDIVVQELKGEILIYDLQINKAYCLNETSALVYQLCDGKHSVADISKLMSRKLKQPVTDELVWLALDQLREDNLLADSQEIEIKFDGLSRREAIRKVGFATLVALPLISSLVAPTAAMAQSGTCVGAACACNARPIGLNGVLVCTAGIVQCATGCSCRSLTNCTGPNGDGSFTCTGTCAANA